MNTNLECRLLTIFTDPFVHFFTGFLHHLFNASWMNTAISDELFERSTGNFTTNRIES